MKVFTLETLRLVLLFVGSGTLAGCAGSSGDGEPDPFDFATDLLSHAAENGDVVRGTFAIGETCELSINVDTCERVNVCSASVDVTWQTATSRFNGDEPLISVCANDEVGDGFIWIRRYSGGDSFQCGDSGAASGARLVQSVLFTEAEIAALADEPALLQAVEDGAAAPTGASIDVAVAACEDEQSL